MADNRHFTDALQNEGSSPVYLEDKKLAERTPVSGAASIANLKFLLVNDDTEGFNTAIKAYIDEAVRSALGALVNNLDKGTAISRILATDVDSDLGTITPANLASLLGVSGLFDSSRNCSLYVKYDVKGGEGLVVFGLRINDLEGQIGIGVVDKNLYIRGVYKGKISDVSWDEMAKQ